MGRGRRVADQNGLRFCTRCEKFKDPDLFGKDSGAKDKKLSFCRECARGTRKGRSYSSSEKLTIHLKHLYGITAEEYAQMLEQQQGVCAICNRPPGKRRLHVDHCHKTGKIRGLLCLRCNRVLGFMRDDPQLLHAMADYVEVAGVYAVKIYG